ncbi:MAG: TIR domain-containing protein [Methanomicrobium sp.]|nr:TIR domain-containing protein [Methanomicrobium sp.]MDD4299483.1 TIR domain-containing protein [Methanomicrobium sp.]
MAIKDYKIFVSYDPENDQKYRDEFENIIACSEISTVESVQTEDIYKGDDVNTVRQKIREKILQDSVVTVVLVGKDTWKKKHIDLEIEASISQTESNPPSGLIGILLPTQSDLGNNQYSYDTIPPRLHKNIQNGFAKMYPWDINLLVIQNCIHEAFERTKKVVPDNSYPPFADDLTGDNWE